MDDEARLITGGFGKWGQAGVPKRGWRCVGIEDLGEPSETCEMCERLVIRYVHEMVNDRYPASLRVGCVCAGNMEENLIAARERDDSMRSRADKKKRWLNRRWKTSAAGHPWIEADGFHVVVYPKKSGGFGATITKGKLKTPSRRFYGSADAAKLAAFDAITRELNKNSR